MITTEVSVGTACANCRMLGHYCRSVIAMDGIPYCDSCYDDQECEAIKAHRIRITGLGGVEDCNLSGPTKSLPVDNSEPTRDVEWKSEWRREMERRSSESVPRRRSATVRIARIQKAPLPVRFCACGNKMKGPSKYGVCGKCSQKSRYQREYGPSPTCSYPGCLQTVHRNQQLLCGWHNPKNRNRAKFLNSKPKMMEAA